MVDAGRRRAESGRIGSVVLHQFLRLERSRRNDTVRLGDDLHLGDDSRCQLGSLVSPLGEILDAPQGVERIRQRNAELPFDDRSGGTAEPVVAVDQIRRISIEDPYHAFGELLDPVHHVFDWGRLGRSGIDVEHPVAVIDLDEIRLIGVRPPGEDIHGDATPDHGAGEFVDVDVHAAGVPHARLHERRGVHRQIGDTFDHAPTPATMR